MFLSFMDANSYFSTATILIRLCCSREPGGGAQSARLTDEITLNCIFPPKWHFPELHCSNRLWCNLLKDILHRLYFYMALVGFYACQWNISEVTWAIKGLFSVEMRVV